MKAFATDLTAGMVVVAISLVCSIGCSRTSMGHWSETKESESAWLAQFEAYNKDQIWHVSAIIPDGYAGGGPVVDIAAQDGRILDMLQTQ